MSLSCREFVDFLLEYLEGGLSDRERGVFEAHIGDCPSCGTYLETYEQTVRLGSLCCEEEGPVPEDVPEELVSAILAARRPESER